MAGGDADRLADAAEILDDLVLDDEFEEFLTLRAGSLLDSKGTPAPRVVRPARVASAGERSSTDPRLRPAFCALRAPDVDRRCHATPEADRRST